MTYRNPIQTDALWRINLKLPLLLSNIGNFCAKFDTSYFKLNYFNVEVQHSIRPILLEKNPYISADTDTLGELISLLERGWTNFGALRLSVAHYTPELEATFALPTFCEVFPSKKYVWMFNGEATKVSMGHVNKCSLTLQIDGKQHFKLAHPQLDFEYQGSLEAGQALFVPQGFTCTWIGLSAGVALQVGLRTTSS